MNPFDSMNCIIISLYLANTDSLDLCATATKYVTHL